MFLPAPELSGTDAPTCLGVHAPAVLTAPDGAVFAVGVTRPAAALALIQAAAPGGLVPERADAASFRLRWFRYNAPIRPEDTPYLETSPTNPGAFPVVIWRAEDQPAVRPLAPLAVAA